MRKQRTFFFGKAERPLYGALFGPSAGDAGGDPGSDVGLVVCDSLFEEKFWCERVFSNLGRHLAGEGFYTLVFDYFGYGNSGGDSADVDPAGIESDIDCSCDLMRRIGMERLVLLAVRWGAAPACRVAARRDDVVRVLLVNPIRSWKTELMKALRANVAGQYSIFKKAVMTREGIVQELLAGGDCVHLGYHMNNIDGYILTKPFWEQAQEVSLPVALPGTVSGVTIFTIPERQTMEPPPEDPLVSAFDSAGIDVEGVADTEDNAFWINNRIFTSIAPRLFGEVASRMADLAGSARPLGAPPVGEAGGRVTVTVNGIEETAVEIPGSGGITLPGVMYVPVETAMRETAFVFTHGGLIGMNGAFRFNTRAARRFAGRGYPSICADTRGMGKADGTLENQEQRVLFRSITRGLFAEDVHRAVCALRDRVGERRFVPFGVCGGAITNIIAQSRYDSIGATVLLSIPVMLPSLRYGELRMTEGYARAFLAMYVTKIFNPKAWWRFLMGRSERGKIMGALAILGRAMLQRLGLRRGVSFTAGGRPPDSGGSRQSAEGRGAENGAARSAEAKGGLSVAVPGIGDDLQFNDVFFDSYRSIVRRAGHILFVFGENDNFKWEFESEFRDARRRDFEAGKDCFEIVEIPHANHMYTLREWQDEIIDLCLKWVE